ncbi:DUF6434 domain-containing protein [Actinomycetospora atypica]|uniref:DUF6434 domain-containing protein n=1 Tax=Actinomycetospora atypica TaxID=1290095 RepID=A0ABV9YN60_9PSEU
MPDPTRPELTPDLSGAELRRWYWTLAELTALARRLGVPARGGKLVLTERLVAALDGIPAPPTPRPPRTAGRQLAPPLDLDTVIPPGQRCSEVLRAFLRAEIGPGFTFDAHVRGFVADGAGRTLADLVAHWHATRDAPPAEIGAQFELNRFLRERRARHPGEPRAEALAAWRAHRALPRDRRP